jgi:AcrR family transcriptional regulator
MTKERILQQALALFTDKGYEGASMDDIAAAVGIKKASLYAHYSGKEAIFSAIFTDILTEYEHFIATLAAPAAGEAAPATLGRVFGAFIRYCFQNPKMYFWDRYFYYPPAFAREVMQRRTLETQQEFLWRITEAVRGGMARGELRAGDADGLALSFYYLMIGLSMSVKLYDAAALQTDIDAAWAGFARAL